MKSKDWLKVSLGLMVLCAVPAYANHGYGYGMGMGMGKIPVLLLALAAGYWVLTLSQTQGRPLDIVGRVVGGLILLVAVGGLLCSAIFGACHWWGMCKSSKMCPVGESKAACHYSGTMEAAPGQPIPPTK